MACAFFFYNKVFFISSFIYKKLIGTINKVESPTIWL